MTTYTYTPAFESAIAFVLEAEGGYVNDPNDAGGETNHGISKRAHPELDIKALTVEQAKAIYFDDYWLLSRADDMPSYMGMAIFDTAVNMGNRTAAKLLQRAAGVLDDGIIGPKTLAAVYKHSPEYLLPQFLSYRALRYHELADEPDEEHNKRFIRGWLKRTFELQQRLYEDRLL
ncbi:glycosyl hydrolase 108 family protein [uncultured Endozoicomonas sp.]|uniref:glycoside hydrolase family 108 protein n=1 Tax=uncultured Endozoicomonas sp. TaxID=432652 RepID=UPI002614C6B4|nr:glycosyl hydrolase 108 family protein [uncultured Endozoicomonas sp.]